MSTPEMTPAAAADELVRWFDPASNPKAPGHLGEPVRTAFWTVIGCARACARTIPAPRVLVVGEDYRSGIGSSSAYAKADLVVDQTGRVLKWRYGPVPEVTR
ncbi:MAG TPA: hypothetical protein VGH85_08835 [Mycobacteriales bacterium]